MNKIIKNATVIYTDGIEEHFDAIRITNKGAIIGKIIDGIFEGYGFIQNHSIKQIKKGKWRKRDIC